MEPLHSLRSATDLVNTNAEELEIYLANKLSRFSSLIVWLIHPKNIVEKKNCGNYFCFDDHIKITFPNL